MFYLAKKLATRKTRSPAIAEKEPIVLTSSGIAVQHAEDDYSRRRHFGVSLVCNMVLI